MLYFFALCHFFLVVAHNTEHFSALLPTTRKNVQRCCLQLWSFFRVVGNNAENSSNFSSCVFFLVYCLHCGKLVGVVGNNVEKWSKFNISTNCEFTLGFQSGGLGLMCSWGKVKVKNLIGQSLETMDRKNICVCVVVSLATIFLVYRMNKT
jgi:hypothetical protein